MTELQARTSPRPATVDADHHAQVGVTPDPELDADLRRRIFALPGIERRDTVVSVEGTDAICVVAGRSIARPDLVHDREFAHVHPDGSLHVTLVPERADLAAGLGWGEPPPAGHRARHPGRILLYTPTSAAEVDVIVALVEESFALVSDGPAPVDALAGSGHGSNR